MDRSTRCWVALVAASQMKHVESILETVDSVGDQMQLPAYAVFLLGDADNIIVTRNHWTPPVVSKCN